MNDLASPAADYPTSSAAGGMLSLYIEASNSHNTQDECDLMSYVGPLIGAEDEFEGRYTEKFRVLLRDSGEFVQYERDRVSIDIGVHLTTPTTTTSMHRRVSHTRIWFQLKGIRHQTLSFDEYTNSDGVDVSVRLNHLRFWFASPEPIYLALYVESANEFLVEDIREVVYRTWGEDFLSPESFRQGQQSVTIRLGKDSVLTSNRIAAMRRHQSMRIDGPYFRGRPLGHRLDPLRCSLNSLEPEVYRSIVTRLLEVHQFRKLGELPLTEIFDEGSQNHEYTVLVHGVLYNTFEWVPHLFTEFGYSPNSDFRIEGEPQFAHGPVAILIDGEAQSSPDNEKLQGFTRAMLKRNIRRFLVFANTDDPRYFGSFFGGCRGTGLACMPQLLGDLPYSLLTATLVYLEFRDVVSWKWTNYLVD